MVIDSPEVSLGLTLLNNRLRHDRLGRRRDHDCRRQHSRLVVRGMRAVRRVVVVRVNHGIAHLFSDDRLGVRVVVAVVGVVVAVFGRRNRDVVVMDRWRRLHDEHLLVDMRPRRRRVRDDGRRVR